MIGLWKDINKEPPTKDGYYIVSWKNHTGRYLGEAQYNTHHDTWCRTGERIPGVATHWTNLPDLPNVE